MTEDPYYLSRSATESNCYSLYEIKI